MMRFLLILLCVSTFCSGAKILALIPTASFSHQVAFSELWKELALRGHEVTLVTTDPRNDANLTNLKEINMKKLYKIWDVSVKANKGLSLWNIYEFFIDTGLNIFVHLLSQPQIQDLITNHENNKFDLVMSEVFYPELLAFGKIYKCPTIWMATIGITSYIEELGYSIHPVVYPDINIPFVGKQHFEERIISTLYHLYVAYIEYFRVRPRRQNIIDRFFGKVISVKLEELLNEIDMMFINEIPLLKGIRDLGPSTIIAGGGNHLKPWKPLPQELSEYLDSAKEGFIYLSLGGNVKSKDLNNQTMSNIMDAFREIPYKVLWKFEANNLPGKPDNVKLIRWAPQQDVLRHPNIKVFITQGGILSIEEAIFTHVPMVVMPFYGDQLKNARIIENKEIGKFVNHKPVLDKDDFKSAVIEVIKNEKYKKSITELAELIQDQPMSGLETAIWWTEYVIRHKGAKHLRNPAADIPFYQYYLLDVLGFLGVVLYIVVRLCIFIVKYIVKYPYKLKEKLKAA